MGASGGILQALTGIGEGLQTGLDARRARARQAQLDAERKAQLESENARRLQQDRAQAAQNALQRTIQTMQAGLRPDRGEPFLGEDVTRTEGGDTGLAGSNSPLMLAARAIQNAKGADRYTLPTESGGQETYRRVPGASKEEQEQAAAQKRLDDQQAAAEALAAQRAKDEHDRAIELEMLRQQGVIKPGSDAWKQMKADEADIQRTHGYHPPEPLERVDTPDGPQFMTRAQALGQHPVQAGNARGVATIKKAIANNMQQISVLDDALGEIDKYPNAIGLKRGIGDLPFMGKVGEQVNQRIDPQGVAARAALSNIGSMVIHDRSGAAVTVSEFPRLAPFVPTVTDTPAAAKIKLQKLKQAIGVETGALQSATTTSPTSQSPKSSGKTLTPEQYQRARQHYSDAEIQAQGYTLPKGGD